jgi:hypothetical protein
VDQSWYSGGAWARPVFDCGGAASGGCAVPNVMIHLAGNYITLDNIEFKGTYLPTGGGDIGMVKPAGIGVEVKNCYFHGWQHGTGVSANTFIITTDTSGGASAVANTSIHDNVIDGYDSYLAGYRDGYGIQNGASAYNNVVRYVFNGINGNFDDIHSNLIEHVDYFAASGLHCNGIYHKGPLNLTTITMHNNVIRDSAASGCVGWYVQGNSICPTCTTYFYDNLVYNFPNAGEPFVSFPGDSGTSGGTFYAYNDTLQVGSAHCIGNGLSTVTGAAHYANFHCINSNGSSGGVCISGGSGLTCTDDAPGHSRLETLTSANTNGYCEPGVGGCTATYPFAPSSGSSPTAALGANESSLVPTFGSAFGYDTSLAVSYDAVNHKVIVPARTALSRPTNPTNWAAGAYQYDGQNALTPPSALRAAAH